MPRITFLAAVLAHPPVWAAESKTRVVVHDLRSTDELGGLAKKVSDQILLNIGKRPGWGAIGEREIEVMLAHAEDRDRLLGCTSGEPCLAELGKAIDAEKIITGHFARWGTGYLITLSLADTAQSAVERGESIQAEDEHELLARTDEVVDALLGGSRGAEKFRMSIAPTGTKVAVINLSADADSVQLATSLTELLSLELKKYDGLGVISRDEVAAMLEYEANKQFIQCKSDIACIVEIGGALGVDYLVAGSVGKLDDTYVITLKLLDANKSEVANRVAESFKGPETSLGQALRSAVSQLLGRTEEGRGTLSLSSSIDGTRASVDGGEAFALALTGSKLDVGAGKHALSFFADGHFTQLIDAYVEDGVATKIEARLEALPTAWYEKWWVWTIIGAVAAGGVTASVLIANRGADDSAVHVSVEGLR